MKKFLLIAAAFLYLAAGSYAQLQNLFRNNPSGYTYKEEVSKLESAIVKGPSTDQIADIIKGNHSKSGDMYIIAQNVPVQMTMQNSGTWTQHNGFKTWQLKIKSDGAQALALLYSKFDIPASAAVYVYNSKFTHKSRPYTSAENPDGDHFSTEIIVGDEIILEYWIPDTELKEASIELEAVSYIFRDGNRFHPKDWHENGSSESCEVNVNCSEGNNWQEQKRGVAKIFLIDGSSGGLCSGSLVNNTSSECKNYFLTAQHCGAAASAANLNQWQFYFNFESPNCNDLTNTQADAVDNQTVIGCTRRAASGNVSDVSFSDFQLVEFNSAIPTSYNVFYNGWDRSTTASTSGVSIHHPAGDIKKISTYTDALQTGSWNGGPANTHWVVQWDATANGNGVTEGGSSGSPIFNSNKRIVGDLSGGSSLCSNPTSEDLYGKFSYSWQSVAGGSARQLASWLDPSGSGATSLAGKSSCGGGPNPVAGCDTVSNFNVTQHTASELTAPGGTGWLAGTNSYGDLAKAEFFVNTFPANSVLTGFYVYFHEATGSGSVTFKVWDDNGAASAPGTVLASGSVAISSIPSNGDPIFLNMTGSPLALNGNFYVGFDIPSSSNSVGMYTTAANEPNINTGWEQYSDAVWHSYEASYNAKYANAIFISVCPAQSSIGENFTYEEAKIFPNPATDHIWVQLPSYTLENIEMTVTDMAGKIVGKFQQPAGSSSYSIPVDGWANGLYHIQIRSGNVVQYGKFVKN